MSVADPKLKGNIYKGHIEGKSGNGNWEKSKFVVEAQAHLEPTVTQGSYSFKINNMFCPSAI